MMTAEQNYLLLQEIEENRRFLLMAYQQNPQLLERAEARIRELIEMSAHGGDNNLSSILRPLSSERGVSLIELVMFIIIISVAVTGVLLVMNKVTGHSADTLIRKQAIAVAESLLEEVELQDFISASGVTACPPNPTPNPVTQANRASQYHIVCDYNGFATSGIFTVADAASASAVLANYNASVAVSSVALGTVLAGSAVRITVTVTDPQSNQVAIDGYRTRY